MAVELEVSFYGHLRRLAGGRVRKIAIDRPDPTVGDLRAAVAEEIPAIAPHLGQTSVAIGGEMRGDEALLAPGVEIALLPPASGGSGTDEGDRGGVREGGDDSARIQEDPLSLDALLEETDGVDAGALVIFGGIVRARDAGLEIAALDYDVHREMSIRAIREIESDLASIEGVLSCRILHRVGTVPAGEVSVYVVVRARHRPEAFAAAREGIERLKREVPIWKEDLLRNG